jgi:hypothetical protein
MFFGLKLFSLVFLKGAKEEEESPGEEEEEFYFRS